MGNKRTKSLEYFNIDNKNPNKPLLDKKCNILFAKRTALSSSYKITGVLGSGSNGKVYECECLFTKKKFALKKLIDCKLSRKEIDMQWKACKKSNRVVKIIDVFENYIGERKVLLVIMELMSGGDLFEKINNNNIQEKDALNIMRQVGLAVKVLHDIGIAHRDIKPENFLLTDKTPNFKIKIADFGFADYDQYGFKTPYYTPFYAAPELIRSERYFKSCDMWSLGVLMFGVCFQEFPFKSKDGVRLSPMVVQSIICAKYKFPNNNFSQECKKLIENLLVVDIYQRYNIDQFLSDDWFENNNLKKRFKVDFKNVNLCGFYDGEKIIKTKSNFF